MFTSRAEFRLSLRADNADDRLTPLAERYGIASADRIDAFRTMRDRLDAAREKLRSITVTPREAEKRGLALNQDGIRRSAYELLAYADIDLARLTDMWPELREIDRKSAESLETEARYSVYLERQEANVLQIRREEMRLIPEEFDFSAVPGLSNEIRQKLRDRRPRSIADAQRMEGMTPAALAIIIAHLRTAEANWRKGAA